MASLSVICISVLHPIFEQDYRCLWSVCILRSEVTVQTCILLFLYYLHSNFRKYHFSSFLLPLQTELSVQMVEKTSANKYSAINLEVVSKVSFFFSFFPEKEDAQVSRQCACHLGPSETIRLTCKQARCHLAIWVHIDAAKWPCRRIRSVCWGQQSQCGTSKQLSTLRFIRLWLRGCDMVNLCWINFKT